MIPLLGVIAGSLILGATGVFRGMVMVDEVIKPLLDRA